MLGLVSLQLTGCVILPLPPLGAQVGREDIETLEPGLSNRDQVHEALGDPDVTVTDRYEIFDVSEESFNLLFVALGPAGGVGVNPISGRFYRVLAEYEPDGILHELYWEGDGEISTEESLPRPAWPDPLKLEYVRGGAVSASPNGRLLAVSVPATPSITLHDGWTGTFIAEIGAIAGCPPLGIDPRDWWFTNRLRFFSRLAFPAATVFLADDTHLASIAANDTLCIWNADTRMRVRELSGGQGTWGVVSARSAPTVAAIDADGIVGVWDGSSGFKLSSIAVCEGLSLDLKMVLSDDGEILATVQHRLAPNFLGVDVPHGSRVQLWDVETGVELTAFDLPKTSAGYWHGNIALSPDLRRVAANLGNHIEIWRIDQMSKPAGQDAAPSKTTAWRIELERVLILPRTYDKTARYSVAFSADGRKLAAGRASAVVWEVDTWREIWRAPPHEGCRLHGFVFTADGRRIISNSCVWEVPELDDPPHSHPAAAAVLAAKRRLEAY